MKENSAQIFMEIEYQKKVLNAFICLSLILLILIDSVYKIGKNYYPQLLVFETISIYLFNNIKLLLLISTRQFLYNFTRLRPIFFLLTKNFLTSQYLSIKNSLYKGSKKSLVKAGNKILLFKANIFSVYVKFSRQILHKRSIAWCCDLAHFLRKQEAFYCRQLGDN